MGGVGRSFNSFYRPLDTYDDDTVATCFQLGLTTAATAPPASADHLDSCLRLYSLRFLTGSSQLVQPNRHNGRQREWVRSQPRSGPVAWLSLPFSTYGAIFQLLRFWAGRRHRLRPASEHRRLHAHTRLLAGAPPSNPTRPESVPATNATTNAAVESDRPLPSFHTIVRHQLDKPLFSFRTIIRHQPNHHPDPQQPSQ